MVEFYKSKYFLVNLKVVLSNSLGGISNTNSECDGYSPVRQLRYVINVVKTHFGF